MCVGIYVLQEADRPVCRAEEKVPGLGDRRPVDGWMGCLATQYVL